MRKYIKYLFYYFRISGLLDQFIFRIAQIRFYKNNLAYRKKHPGILLPGNYDLHETFQLDYRKYMEEGKLAAKEIAAETLPLFTVEAPGSILDWGCGTGRILRHLQEAYPNATLYGCDTHTRRMDWNRKHSMGISFTTILPFPPTPYANNFFDLIIGFSVLTHIDAGSHEEWMAELYRILKPGGILWLTTLGDKYAHQLLASEKRKLQKQGIYTRGSKHPGHRSMTTYHQADAFRKELSRYFAIRQYDSGKTHPSKTGGQDVWILQK